MKNGERLARERWLDAVIEACGGDRGRIAALIDLGVKMIAENLCTPAVLNESCKK